ncbi:MAG: hypothetical protein VZR14_01865 [Hallerella sp.]|jgi:hypothetical protein|nr:hypothetical protein [Hallerella sp.]
MQDTEIKIPNVFLKLAYSELLLSYRTEDLVPLVQNASISSRKLIENAWQEDEMVSVEDNALMIEGISNWLLSKGENLDAFADRMFEKMKHLNSVPKRAILRSYLPFIHDFYEMQDQRQGVLRYNEKRNLFHENMSFVEGPVIENNRHDFLLGHDIGENHPAAVYSSWLLRSLQQAPCLLDLPAYETINTICCQYSAEEALLGRLAGSQEGDTFYVSGIAVGKVVKFAECLGKMPLDLGLSDVADKLCVRADTDVIDTFTGTHLLFKDRYYGAPVSIAEFVYTKDVRTKDPFSGLISSLVQEEYSVWPPVQKAHDELLHKINHVAEIVYYEADDSISVNGKHLMRNVPARILRNVLREYSKTGREEFENREFKRDPEICIDPVNPNFESRLNRVVDHLEKVSDVMSLNRHRRGGFRFEPRCHIDFREEPAVARKPKK